MSEAEKKKDGGDAPPVIDEEKRAKQAAKKAAKKAAKEAATNKKQSSNKKQGGGGGGDKKKGDKGGDKGDKDDGPAVTTRLEPEPAYLKERVDLFDTLYAEFEVELAAKETTPINITLPDGQVKVGESWRTTPMDIATQISAGLAKDPNLVCALINDVEWDLDRVLEVDCTLRFLKFGDAKGEYVFRHSSAHILGEAMECHFGGCLCYGPPVEDGFYYDTYLGEDENNNPKTISKEKNFPHLEKLCKEVVKQKQKFQRLEVTKENLLKMFAYNKFKVRLLNERVKTPTTTVYRCGPLIDLCRGPHVQHTGKVKHMALTKTSATYWEGNAEAENLQRCYGISFPDKKQLQEWKILQEEAAKRDHRRLGVQQELFFFNEMSPGCAFFLPRGAFIYNTLMDFMKEQYVVRGFQEVVTPNMFNIKLWETSGHWQNYQEDMFSLEVEKETFALKPMNCPSHCLLYKFRPRSYKEFPFRYADFGVLHRNEDSGALSGLTRVRRFCQDDAHIFILPDQIEEEMGRCLEFLEYTYGVFGFTFELFLSTRPEKKYLGEISTWDYAEKALENSLNKFGKPWTFDRGGGAFYGPKIDIKIMDALKRRHQCATIQLDYQLPIRFDLEYVPAEKTAEKSRPVIIHRAILGSVERMIAILTENYGGKWPFWLNPRQAQIIPVVPTFNEYALEVSTRLRHLGFQVDAGVADGNTLNKKVRNAQLEQYCFIFVVGATEQDSDCVDIRLGTGARQGQRSIAEVIAHFTVLSKTRGTVVDFPINEQQITEMEATQAKVTHQVEEAKTQLGNISDRLSKLEN